MSQHKHITMPRQKEKISKNGSKTILQCMFDKQLLGPDKERKSIAFWFKET